MSLISEKKDRAVNLYLYNLKIKNRASNLDNSTSTCSFNLSAPAKQPCGTYAYLI